MPLEELISYTTFQCPATFTSHVARHEKLRSSFVNQTISSLGSAPIEWVGECPLEIAVPLLNALYRSTPELIYRPTASAGSAYILFSRFSPSYIHAGDVRYVPYEASTQNIIKRGELMVEYVCKLNPHATDDTVHGAVVYAEELVRRFDGARAVVLGGQAPLMAILLVVIRCLDAGIEISYNSSL